MRLKWCIKNEKVNIIEKFELPRYIDLYLISVPLLNRFNVISIGILIELVILRPKYVFHINSLTFPVFNDCIFILKSNKSSAYGMAIIFARQ